MASLRNNDGPESTDDAVSRGLDAARESILAVGWRRTTLTDVARRAGVSRMTMYRRWPDMQTLLADLMTREWATAAPDRDASEGGADAAERIAADVVSTAQALRGNPLFRRIVEVDPELLLPYLLDRRGRTQDALLDLIRDAITAGQDTGEVRPGDPTVLARAVVLATHGHVLSAETMTDPGGPGTDDLDAELRTMIQRYLAP